MCSAADRMFDCGAFTTMTPRRVAAGDVHVVEADPGPAHHLQMAARGQHLVGYAGGRADYESRRAIDGLEEVPGRQAQPDVDIMARLSEEVEAGLGDFFGYQDAGHGGHGPTKGLGGPVTWTDLDGRRLLRPPHQWRRVGRVMEVQGRDLWGKLASCLTPSPRSPSPPACCPRRPVRERTVQGAYRRLARCRGPGATRHEPPSTARQVHRRPAPFRPERVVQAP